MSSGGCPACGTALSGGARCPSCGAAAGLLSLELPPAGAAVEAPPAPVAPPPPARAKATRRLPSPHEPGPAHGRAALVAVPRSNRLDLPAHCVCCDAEKAGEVVVETGTAVVGGISQAYAVDVPYCRGCRGHLRRPAWRTGVFLLAIPVLVYLGWRLNPVRPESFLQGAGLVLAVVVAARALSYVLVPRLGLGRRHARESRSLWVRGFDADHVTLAACHAGYRARLEGKPAAPRPLLELRRRLSSLIFGSERPVVPLLRPLLTLGLAAAGAAYGKPMTEEARSLESFRAAPSRELALYIGVRFPQSKHRAEMEDYLWSSALSSPSKEAYQFYLRFPKARHHEEAKRALADFEVNALLARMDRKAAMKFIAEHPASPRLAELRAALFKDVTASAVPSKLAPSVAVLRRIWDACPDGKVPVAIRGLGEDDYRREMEGRLKEALRAAGLVLTLVEEDPIIDVAGESGQDRTFAYSKFGFGSSGPFAEFARAEIRVRLGGRTAWSGNVSARSPETISYTTFRFGSGSPIDTGPSQFDVHSQTLPKWTAALAPLFQYGP